MKEIYPHSAITGWRNGKEDLKKGANGALGDQEEK